MAPSQQNLWNSIQDFKLDNQQAAFPFTKKLMKENNWSKPFAERAIGEYKKFLLLCCISPTGASPSEVVDKVWHLHLTYTKSYWDDLCRDVLRQPLHHHPSSGGQHESEKHHDWYLRTLAFYEEIFGVPAPADIWPAPAKAFPIKDGQQADKRSLGTAMLIGFLLTALLAITYLQFGTINPYSLNGPEFLAFMVFLFVTAISAAAWIIVQIKSKLEKHIQENYPGSYSIFEAIHVIRGDKRCVQSIILDGVNQGYLEALESERVFMNKIQETGSLPTDNPLREILINKKQDANLTYDELDSDIRHSKVFTQSPFAPIIDLKSQKAGWRWVPLRIVLMILVIRLFQGISTHHAVGFLCLGIFLFSLIYALAVAGSHPARMVARLVEHRFEEDKITKPYLRSADNSLEIFAAGGLPSLGHLAGYAAIAGIFAMHEPNRNMSGSCGSSGCSSGGGSSCGSSCGGGCGGCGGS